MVEFKVLNDDELSQIDGGIDLTGSMLSAIASSINAVYKLGYAVGRSTRRILAGQLCEL